MIRWAIISIALAFAAPPSADEPKYDDFGEFLESFRSDNNTPSLSALIIKDGEIVWEGYFGTYDDEGELPTRPETTYKIASITKPIAATALLAEELNSSIDLDAPMAADDRWTELCQFFLTTPVPFMSGGIDRHGNAIAPVNCEKPTSIREMLNMRANGESFVYNPIGYARIDRAVLGAGGRDLRDIMRERVANPAGMADTALGWRDPKGGAALRFLAEPFHPEDGRIAKQPLPDDDLRAAAGIVASVRSLAAFDIAYDADVLGLPEAFRKDLVIREIGPLGDYRQGWFLEDWNGERLIWHSGWNEKQYSGLYLKVPRKGLTLIALANTEAIWWGNSLVKAEVVESPIALKFLEDFAR